MSIKELQEQIEVAASYLDYAQTSINRNCPKLAYYYLRLAEIKHKEIRKELNKINHTLNK